MQASAEHIFAFGFGSFFFGKEKYRDIDVLAVHGSLNIHSCSNVIYCKRLISILQPLAHVTVLSQDTVVLVKGFHALSDLGQKVFLSTEHRKQ
jgi:hypothetical protein